MLERAIDRIALRRAQLLEIAFDALPRRHAAFAVGSLQIAGNLFAR
jgi:hypothetical protein